MAGALRLGLDPIGVSWLVGVACCVGVLAVIAHQGLAAYRGRPWIAAVCWIVRTVTRRRRPLPLAVWCAVGAFPVMAHLGWRLAYDGDWLPNTLHAKVAGLWWGQGARYLGLFADDDLALAFLPLYWMLHADGLDALLARVHDPAPRRFATGLAAALSAALLAAVAAGHVRGADAGTRDGVADLGVVSRYAASRVDEGRFLRGLIDGGLLPPDVVICVGGAGAVPDYTDWTTVDRRGLNDRRIAATALQARGRVAREHDIDYAYLVERGVIVFDAANRIVRDELVSGPEPQWFELDGVPMPVHAVRAGDRYLVFASPASWDDSREAFGRLEIVD